MNNRFERWIARGIVAFGLIAALVVPVAGARAQDAPRFHAMDIDREVGIGYGLALVDVDGDSRTDIVLVDSHEIFWYRNPYWRKHTIVRRLTERDHVSIAARDIDGDGRAELAAGAGWNPGDTVGSGSVHALVRPAEPTSEWTPIRLHHEPTVHRMRWVKAGLERFELVVAPLHGRGNRNAEGAGVKILAYAVPESFEGEWTTSVVDDSLHLTHNLDPVDWDDDPEEEILLASREGVFLLDRAPGGWARTQISGPKAGETDEDRPGAGEVRAGRGARGERFVVTVEPFHGNSVVVYTPSGGEGEHWKRRVLDDTLNAGHAVACGDLLGRGGDQVVVGWRSPDQDGKVGIRLYVPPEDPAAGGWSRHTLDDNRMACEDLLLADLDDDGKLDVVAAGRATHNLTIYWNRRP